jgi:hypothetical protein
MDALESSSILYRISLACFEAEFYCRIMDELRPCDPREQGMKKDVTGSRRFKQSSRDAEDIAQTVATSRLNERSTSDY